MTTLRETVWAVIDRWDSLSSGYSASYLFEMLRAALEQPEQEPVAWGMPDALGNIVETISPDEKITDMKAWANQYSVPLYTAPPQRKPLTDEEIAAIVRVAAKGSAIKRDGSTSQRIARAIEQAHGIKGEV